MPSVSRKSAERYSVDANILVYAADPGAGEKYRRAAQLVRALARRDTVLTLQALGEFFWVITRKGKCPVADAHSKVTDWQTVFPITAASPATLNRAMTAVENYRLGFWDAMLWATAKEAGVTLLLSEDFQHGLVLDGVRIVNPFLVKDLAEVL